MVLHQYDLRLASSQRFDGIISGGLVTATPWGGFETAISVTEVWGRLNNVDGKMTSNILIISASNPTYNRYEVIYFISPASWIPYPTSDPSPPGFDTMNVAGIASASPVLPGSVYAPTAPFVTVGFDGTVYFAALCSFIVPAGATSSSQYTNITDIRRLVL